jgi:hypothetical protein
VGVSAWSDVETRGFGDWVRIPRSHPVGALDLLNLGNLVELVGDDRDGAPVAASTEVSELVTGDRRQDAPDPLRSGDGDPFAGLE